MASAREILDERLAKGEITAQQHEELAGRLDRPHAAAASPAGMQPATPSSTRLKMFLNIGGVIGSLILLNVAIQTVQDIIGECISRGGSAAICQATAVNWPMVYGGYAVLALIGISSAVSLFLSRKRAA